MEMKVDYSRKPKGLLLCAGMGCARRESCLRHLALLNEGAGTSQVLILNPNYIGATAECSHYLRPEPVRYAKGFVQVLGSMPHAEHVRFVSLLKRHYERRRYFAMRRGDELLSPARQRHIEELYREVTGRDDFHFDAYVETQVWG